MDNKSNKCNSWTELWNELKWRTTEPCNHVSFVLYFFVSVIVVGLLGFWIELYSYLFSPAIPLDPNHPPIDPLLPIRTSIITFFPVLAGGACLQLIWAENEKKYLRAVSVFFLIVTIATALIIAPVEKVSSWKALLVGFFASVFSLWLWWITNATQNDILDKINPDDSWGGNPNGELAGDLSGYEA